MPELWERSSTETDKSWSAFIVFRDLGPSRTLIDAYRRVSSRPSVSKLTPMWYSWSSKFNWRDRANSYDSHIDNLRLSEVESAVRAVAVAESEIVDDDIIWKNRRASTRARMFDLGESMLIQAKEMMDYPVVQQKLVTADGTWIVMPAKWYDKQVAASIAKAGCELIRQSAGTINPPVENVDVGEIVVEERKASLPKWLKDVLESPVEVKTIDKPSDKPKVNGNGLYVGTGVQ